MNIQQIARGNTYWKEAPVLRKAVKILVIVSLVWLVVVVALVCALTAGVLALTR